MINAHLAHFLIHANANRPSSTRKQVSVRIQITPHMTYTVFSARTQYQLFLKYGGSIGLYKLVLSSYPPPTHPLHPSLAPTLCLVSSRTFTLYYAHTNVIPRAYAHRA